MTIDKHAHNIAADTSVTTTFDTLAPAFDTPFTSTHTNNWTNQLLTWVALNQDKLIGFRRYLHSHPELSGNEFGTAAFIADQLQLAGLNPRIIAPGNGVICDVAPPGTENLPLIAIRGDIDALPLHDVKDVSYRSLVDGACHACGHDAHAAMAFGTALALHALPALFGRVRFIFQPSEETSPSGARHMIEAGALDEVSSIYAFHCDPHLPVGQLGLRVGPITAACSMLNIELSGPGGHTARPQETVDVIHTISTIISQLPAMLSRRVDPRHCLSVVFGAIQAGNSFNAIPDKAVARASVRSLDRGLWDDAGKIITNIVNDLASPSGAKVTVDYIKHVPPVINDPNAIDIFNQAITQTLGSHAISTTPQSLGGEDFSWYLEKIPGAMVRLGVAKPDAPAFDLHRPSFDIDEKALGYGVSVFGQLANIVLSRQANSSLTIL